MPRDHYVIIGNGPAGNHAAHTLRQSSAEADITIISDEKLPYYFKPKLTGYLSGEVSKDDLVVRDSDYYESNQIELVLGRTVERLDTHKKELILNQGAPVSYTKLIIASGSRARVLPGMESYAEHLRFVTSYTDVMNCKDEIANAQDFFIFGGDLVGFKFIRLLRAMNKNVTLLIYPNAFWPYNLNKEMETRILNSLSHLNVRPLVRDDIGSISPRNNAFSVQTVKGVEIDVDMVFSFNGLVPNIDFINGSGIKSDHGILVDEYLKTSVDDVYACGSCAQVYHPDIDTYVATIGWPNAVVQGKAAAANLLGAVKGIDPPGRKYFDMEGVKIKTTWWEYASD